MEFDMDTMRAVLEGLRYAYPAAVFLYFVVASLVSVFTLQTVRMTFKHPRHSFISYLMVLISITYLGQVAAVAVPSIREQHWLGQQQATISQLSCFLVFGLLAASMMDSNTPVWYPYIGSYLLELLFDAAVAVLSILTHKPAAFVQLSTRVDLAIVVLRITTTVLLLALYAEGRERRGHLDGSASERQPLLPKKKLSSSSEESGETQESQASACNQTTDNERDDEEAPKTVPENETPYQKQCREGIERAEKRLRDSTNWFTYGRRFLMFFPYLWPVDNRLLQLRAVLTGLCLFGSNILHLLVPIQFGILTDSFIDTGKTSPWTQFLIFAVLKLADSEVGISLLRGWLWLPVNYYSEETLGAATFSHVMRLSSDFHDDHSSINVVFDVRRGVNGVTGLLEIILLKTTPMAIDLILAFGYLSWTFGPYSGLITAATALAFFLVSKRLLRKKQESFRVVRDSDRVLWNVTQSSIQDWPTVTNFDRVTYEEGRQLRATQDSVRANVSSDIVGMASGTCEFAVFFIGLMTSACLVIYQIMAEDTDVTPGDLNMLLLYWVQLTGPLSFFSGLAGKLSNCLVGAERLLEIMLTRPTICDRAGSWNLKLRGGKVTFDRVSFSYDNKKDAIRNVSFVAMPGTTTAFVGHTGAGKSSMLKLINRLYDVKSGSVKIDGQDVRDVKLSSLRSAFGIVPQDPTLFEGTIMSNVRYAKLDATDDEIYEACKAASIHDDIMGFPEGYQRRVGAWHNSTLSGGQKQRIAVARAILKRPAIVMLDEASSAVDTETEQKIHASLAALCKGRTTFIVAHRLSTVMNADNIIVVDDGRIIEQGNHEALIKANGKYASLWSKQAFWKPKAQEPQEEQILIDDVQASVEPLIKLEGDSPDGSVKNATTNATSAPQKEVRASKLNPIASTFTPRNHATAMDASTKASVLQQDTPKSSVAVLKAAFDEPTSSSDADKPQGSPSGKVT